MGLPTRAVRWGVALLLCLPVAVACDDAGSDEGAGPSGGVEGGGVPGPGKGGGAGGGSGGKDGGGKPGPLKIPEWGQNGALFDNSTFGKEKWASIQNMFIEACGDGTLCVRLERIYRSEDGVLVEGPCGYDHMDPAAGTRVQRGKDTTVFVVGVCGSEPTDPPESTEPGQTPEPTDTTEPTQPTDATQPTDTDTATAS
ncbi:hypothetical protein [Streptomyces sp. NPDC127092]|uniref:hypothetical protein n=1 Tax=Streptomyces sp. NPDC127092 TaxID=3347135 RepID=UPI00365BC7FF